MSKKIDTKWVGARIVFNFALCPLCKKWLEFTRDCPLWGKMRDAEILFEDIKKKVWKDLSLKKD